MYSNREILGLPSRYGVVALVGLSGVGKSTLLRQIGDRLDFVHLEASRLIKDELKLQKRAFTSEELRRGNITQNQDLLVSGFYRAVEGQEGPFIVDGHVLIDTDSGLEEIPSAVFKRLGVELFCLVQAAPEQIVAQRLTDVTRSRPQRGIAEIAAQQDQSVVVCARIARSLNVPAIMITSETPGLLLQALRPEVDR